MELITLEYIDVFDKNEKKSLEFSASLLKKPYSKSSLFVMRVDGKSMEPLIQDASLVVVDLSQKELVNDAIYIVNIHNKSWIKRAKIAQSEEFFISINQDFAHLVYRAEDVRLIGRALLAFSAL